MDKFEQVEGLAPEGHAAAWLGLMCDIANGNRDALARLYDEAGRMVYLVCLRILRHPGDAEEAAHDTWVQVWRQAARFSPARGTVAAWLVVLARSRAIDRLRQIRLREASSLDVLTTTPPAPGPLPDVQAEARRVAHRLRGAIAGLPAEQRRLIELAFFEGLTHTEIARRVSVPLGTVKTRIRTGLLRLRGILAPAQSLRTQLTASS